MESYKGISRNVIATDKKVNARYWDDIDEFCELFARRFVDTFAMGEVAFDYDEQESFIDLAKSIEDTLLQVLGACGADTNTAFPFVDEEM